MKSEFESTAHADTVRDDVRDYYGKVLNTNADLKTSACCSVDAMPEHVKTALANVHDEVLAKFYGCGCPIPEALAGRTVLDLGCGTGRDAYLLSQLVGEAGAVIGIDMTDEQLEVAERHQAYHAERFGYAEANISFRKGYIEDLKAAGVADDSVDAIVSNCVINLSPDKPAVFRECFRVLKPGGEIYISDVFADRRLPEALRQDPVVVGECLGGAMYVEDFRRLLLELGCADFRVVAGSSIEVTDPDVAAKTGNIEFRSLTIRAFKLDLEDRCEDYGQVATYRGSLPESPHRFVLDDHHVFETGRPMLVCGNTAAMLQQTRFADHFEVRGDTSTHFGLFDCGPGAAASVDGDAPCC